METILEKKNDLNPDLWFAKYGNYLFAMARLKLPEDKVEDIVQDTFLAALGSAPGFKGLSSERVWLTSILNHKIMDHYRRSFSKKGRAIHTAIRVADYPDWHDWDGATNGLEHSDVNDYLDAIELDLVLNSGMDQLGSREQQVLKMKIKGFSTEAICDTLDINKVNAWVALSRARKKMKNYLAENW
ncbi:sigma-70 family RNA polymerase sigma factor [Allomuricauda sp. M10]|uniref:sigma-70 family RNA polymerase sigma factor n=1 Tax=Allomuricauda sp. M10 TaxID=2683292 RepID=UPI001D17F059|nr:sigma-70 family RNA polymerase sigma factor [Muricauda sp. M10]